MPVSTNNIVAVEFDSSVSFDPIPLQVPCPPVYRTSIDPLPMFSGPNVGNNTNNSMAVQPTNWDIMRETSVNHFVSVNHKSAAAADHVLDDAVDELFNHSEPMAEDFSNLDDLWDTSAFGDTEGFGTVQNDTQLGYLLERFIQES
jgi:hypothetical protein